MIDSYISHMGKNKGNPIRCAITFFFLPCVPLPLSRAIICLTMVRLCSWFFNTITLEGQNFTCMGHQVKKSTARVEMILKMLRLFL